MGGREVSAARANTISSSGRGFNLGLEKSGYLKYGFNGQVHRAARQSDGAGEGRREVNGNGAPSRWRAMAATIQEEP